MAVRFRYAVGGYAASLENAFAQGRSYPKVAPIGASSIYCFPAFQRTCVGWQERYPGVPKPAFTYLTRVSCYSDASCMAIGKRSAPGWVGGWRRSRAGRGCRPAPRRG